MKKIKQNQKKRAFTLIELIVAMAVIGILVLLAAPKFMGYTEMARKTKDLHTAKVIETTLEAYLNNGGTLPDNLEVVDSAVLTEALNQNSLLGVDGYLTEIDNKVYYELTYDFIKNTLGTSISAELRNEILITAEASVGKNEPSAVYSTEDGTTIVNKMKSLKGFSSTIPAGPTTPTYSEEVQALINEGYLAVATPDDLNNVRNNLSGKYIQVNNIELSSIDNFEPIVGFSGIFDGGNYAISNLSINRGGQDYVGLFGTTTNASIKNISLKNINIVGKNHTSGLIGLNIDGSISNVSVQGTVQGALYTGGIIGQSRKGEISYSSSHVVIKGDSYTGGLIGQSSGNIGHSYSNSEVSVVRAGASDIGGLVGKNEGVIANSYFTGVVSASKNRVGGLVGSNSAYIEQALIENCFSVGTITGENYLGVLVGTNAGSVIKNSRSMGSATSVSAGVNVSPTIGYSVTAEVNYLGTRYTHYAKLTDVKSSTELQMQSLSNFSAWDFANIWEMLPGAEHPTLINNKEK